MPLVVAPPERSPIRFPLMTTSPEELVMTAGLTPAEICRVEEIRTFPAIGVPAVIMALANSVPVFGGAGGFGLGGRAWESIFISPVAKMEILAPAPPIPSRLFDLQTPPVARMTNGTPDPP